MKEDKSISKKRKHKMNELDDIKKRRKHPKTDIVALVKSADEFSKKADTTRNHLDFIKRNILSIELV